MKTGPDFEAKYAEVLKECTALFEEESRYEKQQISLALRIGARIDQLVEQVEDKEAVYKRMARDMFKARGKLVTPSKILEYRQLYLNFHSMETIETMGKAVMGDVTIGTLSEIAMRDEGQTKKAVDVDSPLMTMLKKVNRILDRFQVAMENNQPDDNDLIRILEELKLISEKSETILHSVKKTGGRSQLDMFRGPTTIGASK